MMSGYQKCKCVDRNTSAVRVKHMTVLAFEKSRRRVAQAANYIAGGVNSNYRLGISPTPPVIDRAEGAYVYDIDNNRLIDYYLGMGPMILGHSPEQVVAQVEAQLRRGILYAGQSEIEYEAAKLVCQMVPCA